MIVYLANKARFKEDLLSNRIEEIILDHLKRTIGSSKSKSEIASWRNSLPYMGQILEDTAICPETGVAIEFQIPSTGRRIDFILTGKREDGIRTAVVVELKQWQKAAPTTKDGIVRTFLNGGEREVSHPSYQAWSYAMLIEDFNESVRIDPIHLHPCAYLHNCESKEVINDKFYEAYTKQAPAFLKDDALRLREFIKKHLKSGDNGETMFRIRDGKIRPSKCLADHLASLLQGNREFYMIDDQKVVYETALHLVGKASATNKQVLIVNGGPGTGKSVVAINLLVELIQRDQLVQYVTKNSAPRAVYEKMLSGKLTKTRISNLFVGSGKFTETESNIFGALIVDEAHRLNKKSGLYANRGENQVKEIINSATCSVFFIDESQKVHWKDIGTKGEITRWADELDAEVTELTLESQFRCNGSDGYLAWIDNTLGIRETANPTFEGIDYEFKVCDSPAELRDLIYAKNAEANRARMVAGYCWEWVSKKSLSAYDIEFPEHGFAARWNLDSDGSLWIISKNSVKEVGCIHTCQGLEVDYIGVILGPDFLVRDDEIITDASKRDSRDKTILGYKGYLKAEPEKARAKASEIIKNTYRTLMSRGSKGCFVYSGDPETNQYLKEAAAGASEPDMEVLEAGDAYPYKVFSPDRLDSATNVVPKINLKIAAGSFSEEQFLEDCEWAELPEPFAARPGYFVAQVIGESMNRKIPNGSWCLFRKATPGSREGKVVLVQHRDIHDADQGGSYTVKIYHSEKRVVDESWEHATIHLKPDTTTPGYSPIVLTGDIAAELSVIGELVAVVS